MLPSVMFIQSEFYFSSYFFTRADFSFDLLFFIKSIWWNPTKILNIKRWVSFCCCYGKKNDRNLKNISWTHAVLTTTIPTPKFWPTLMLWTHAIHAIFLTYAKLLWTNTTHATHAKVWTTLPTNPCTHATHVIHAPTPPMPLMLFSRLLCNI